MSFLAGLLIVTYLIDTRAGDSVPSDSVLAIVGEHDVAVNRRLAATELRVSSSRSSEFPQQTETNVKDVGSMPSLMRQERNWNVRRDSIEIDGKAHIHEEPSLQLHGPMPPTFAPQPEMIDSPAELSLALLSEAVYNFTTPVNEWLLQGKVEAPSDWLPGNTHAALYKRTREELGDYHGEQQEVVSTTECAIVFALTGSFTSNWTKDPIGKTTLDVSQCKIQHVHTGVLEEWQNILLQKSWKTEIGDWAGENCDAVYTGGHHLGGAIASLYAACASSAMPINGSLIIGIPPLLRKGIMVLKAQARNLSNVTGLYTFGAPAVSKKQLINHRSDDGSFAGGRFYDEDYWFFDAIPFSGRSLGYVHPKVAAIRLRGSKSGWIERIEFDATSVESSRNPVESFRNGKEKECEPHTYVERLHRSPPKTGVTVPGIGGRTSKTTPAPVGYVKVDNTKSGHAEADSGAKANGIDLNETLKPTNASFSPQAFEIPASNDSAPERGSQMGSSGPSVIDAFKHIWR